MTTQRKLLDRFWRSYDPLPSPAEAIQQPFRVFPSWFLRIECDACGKVRFLNESHFARGELPLRAILKRMRHKSCGGRPAPRQFPAARCGAFSF